MSDDSPSPEPEVAVDLSTEESLPAPGPSTYGYLMSIAPTTARDSNGDVVAAIAFHIAAGDQVVMRVTRLNVASQILANALQNTKFHIGTDDAPVLGLVQAE